MSMLLSKAFQGYNFDKSAQYSPNTLKAYQVVHRNMIDFLGDIPVRQVTPEQLTQFIIWLQNDYKPNRSNGDDSAIAPSYVDLHWKGVRSFFNWAHKALDIPRPDLDMPRPKFTRAHVKPFSEDEIRLLIKGCEQTPSVSRKGKAYTRRIITVHRNKAIILALLDTGLRIGELLRLTVRDVDFDTGEILVAPFGTGRKTKPRFTYLGATARRALWLYVAKKEDPRPSDHLFTSDDYSPLTDNAARLMLRRLGKRVGIEDVHPHKFRHTFAIWYLRNGGDVFTLQRILGHSTLDMVNHYLAIAKADVATAHRRASPLDRWARHRAF